MFFAEVSKTDYTVIRVLRYPGNDIPEWTKETEDILWVETSPDSDKKFAAIGDIYMTDYDVFVRPQPFPSWTFNESISDWESPVPHPDPDNLGAILFEWDEDLQEWTFVQKDS